MFFKHFTTLSILDKSIISFDNFLKTMTHTHGGGGIVVQNNDSSSLENINTEIENPILTKKEKEVAITQSIRLMRINHVGEICAQALYQGQSLTTKVKYQPEMTAQLQHFLQKSSDEESHHLIWCKSRLEQLNGRTSLLSPIWYVGSFGLGMFAGLLKPHKGLGFILHTEEQVEKHLQEHIEKIHPRDIITVKLLQKMQNEEKQHRIEAVELGGRELPKIVQWQMSIMSAGMKKIAFYI